MHVSKGGGGVGGSDGGAAGGKGEGGGGDGSGGDGEGGGGEGEGGGGEGGGGEGGGGNGSGGSRGGGEGGAGGARKRYRLCPIMMKSLASTSGSQLPAPAVRFLSTTLDACVAQATGRYTELAVLIPDISKDKKPVSYIAALKAALASAVDATVSSSKC